MKRLGMVVLTVILTICCFSGSAFAAAKTTEAIKGTPKIDGTIDAIWKNAKTVETKVWVSDEGPWATGKFSTMWDENYFYVLAQVSDKLLSDKSANAWEKDSAEVYLDELNEKIATGMDGNDGQYRADIKNANSGNGQYGVTELKTAVKEVKGGYVVEFAIAWKDLKGKAKAGTIVGFDCQVNDDATGTGIRDGIVCWNDNAADKYQNPSTFGNCKLVDAVVAAAKTTATSAVLPTTGSEIPTPVIFAAGLCLLAAGMLLVTRKIKNAQNN
ncbi:MAG: sugar-binding protein [Clostridiaceae bacterium]